MTTLKERGMTYSDLNRNAQSADNDEWYNHKDFVNYYMTWQPNLTTNGYVLIDCSENLKMLYKLLTRYINSGEEQ